jgi:hypothetical protein
MKQLTITTAIVLILAYSLAGCEAKCWQAKCTDDIVFQLVDKATQQNLVFGPGKKYSKDSMQLNKVPDFNLGITGNLLANVNVDNSKTSPVSLIFTTGKPVAGNSYLRLSYNDIDTLTIEYSYEETKCCKGSNMYGKPGSIKYNGLPATVGNNGIYKFEKQ